MSSEQPRRPFWHLRRPRRRIAEEIDEELRTHLDLREHELRARGLPPDAARLEAARQFGDIEQTRSYCLRQDIRKDSHMGRMLSLEEVLADVRISLRGLRRSPVMALTIIASVGVGVGATTLIFAAVHAALLRPLPYAAPERLVRIYTDSAPNKFPFSVADYLALTAEQTRFEDIAGYTGRSLAFSDETGAVRVRARAVSWNYFRLLGIRPAVGRAFDESDSRPGSAAVVVVSDGFWRRHLNARPNVVGEAVRLDGEPYVVAGILPPGPGPLEARQDVFIAARWTAPPRRGPFFITVLGRLRPGAERAAADDLHAINRRLFPLWRSSYQDERATWNMMDLKAFVVGDVGAIAGLASAAVALVWLIACVNASSLLVARITSRRRELAMRSALGASRGRVVRYLLTESTMLASGAAAVAVAIIWPGIVLLRTAGDAYFPRMTEAAIDGPVLALLATLTVLSVALFGIVPALHGSGGRLDATLRASSRSSTAGAGARRLRQALVGGQFAIATPLLVVAGLLLVSLTRLSRVDVGFDPHNVLTGSIVLPPSQYADTGGVVAFWDNLQRRLEAVPEIERVAFADSRPPADAQDENNFELEDLPTVTGRSQPVTPWVAVSPGYFDLLPLRLLEGRLLDERDAPHPNIESVVVDRAWARRFFPNGSAIGKRMKEGGCTSCPWTIIVGVVEDVKYTGLDKPDDGTVYWELQRQERARYVMVRTRTTPSAPSAGMREA
jgi:predicted permease